MKKLFIYLSSIILIVLHSCGGYQNGPADMKYLIHTDKPGQSIKPGDFLSVNFIHRTEEDSVIANSFKSGKPALLEQQKPFFKGDIFSGLSMLSEGDSATFKLNFDSMQTILNVMKPSHTKGHYLLFTVKVEKVIPRGDLNDSLFKIGIERFLAEEGVSTQN
ncbi:hypothetical protein ACFSJU_03765 [Paradesertivirga mongoliensis]|uniref:Uncharacterized protein n=1 Tax=Paradesertivirga mongoliensis TaxID=2100740 RepID=A0ABW4ZHJ3_9SPHI|nr:hypothetical protein [Pedobacter mongoliensis]